MSSCTPSDKNRALVRSDIKGDAERGGGRVVGGGGRGGGIDGDLYEQTA